MSVIDAPAPTNCWYLVFSFTVMIWPPPPLPEANEIGVCCCRPRVTLRPPESLVVVSQILTLSEAAAAGGSGSAISIAGTASNAATASLRALPRRSGPGRDMVKYDMSSPSSAGRRARTGADRAWAHPYPRGPDPCQLRHEPMSDAPPANRPPWTLRQPTAAPASDLPARQVTRRKHQHSAAVNTSRARLRRRFSQNALVRGLFMS